MNDSKAWRKLIADAQTDPIAVDNQSPVTMLIEPELKMLHALARDHFRNEGHIIDAGCFFGGSTCAFARGIQKNPRWQANPRNKIIDSYDLFEVEPWTIGLYHPHDTKEYADFEPIFRDNIAPYADLVNARKGNILKEPVFAEPVEILFIDLAKTAEVSDHVNRMFFPRLIPGHSLVIQQDYIHAWTGWLQPTMEYFSDYFEIVGDTEINSVVFLYKKQIPQELLERNVIASLSIAELYTLSKRAASKYFNAKQRIAMEEAWSIFLENHLKTSRSKQELRDYKLTRMGLGGLTRLLKKAA